MRCSTRKWLTGAGLGVLAMLTAVACRAPGRQDEVPGKTGLRWQNKALHATWRPGEAAVHLRNLRTDQSIRIPVAIAAVGFDAGRASGFQVEPGRVTVAKQQQTTTWRFALKETAIPNGDARVRCSVEFEFDKAAPWVRKKALLEVTGNTEPLLLEEVVLGDVEFKEQHPRQPFGGWQSYPVLADSFFCGVDFPVASARVEGDVARLSYTPGTRLTPDCSYATWSAVYGATPAGESREAFESYIESLRKTATPIHIQYNSWWSAPAPFTEQHMLDLMQVFHDEFYKAHGARLDTFCLDMGWSKLKSVWRIDEENFPQGFGNLDKKLGAMESRLGLWVSPTSHYPGGLDNSWADQNGYETFPREGRRHPYACLAGANYKSAFRDSLVDMIRRYGITHFKFDGYQPVCSESDHGHEPGELSAEKVALGVIDVFTALREANPKVWIEATCFGFKPSPWWLAHVDTVIGTFGDDAPHGRVPCPIYRESYTTGRDSYNLQGAKDILAPIRGQEVLGIIHQTEEPLQNDAVTTILRGHSFLPLYVNPKYMDARRWRFLARVCSWARSNATLLARTKPLYLGAWAKDMPEPGKCEIPRDAYGYAHCDGEKGLLLLRNPWVKPTKVELVLNESTGFPRKAKRAVCLYPEFGRLEDKCAYGKPLTVELKPYETKLLAFGGYKDVPALTDGKHTLAAKGVSPEVSKSEGKVQLEFNASGSAPSKQLWVLAEGDGEITPPDCRMEADGKRIEPEIIESVTGWRATGRKVRERWAWAIGELPAGASRVKLNVAVLDDVRVSAWLVGKRPVPDDPDPSRPIPPPEESLLDAVEVLAPVDLKYGGAEKLTNVALESHGAKATASSIWSDDHLPRLVTDGMVSSRWNSAQGDKDGAWVQIDFGGTRRIREIRFLEAAGGRITKYKLQRWDGAAWVDLVSASKSAKRSTVRHRFEPVETSKVRLLVVAADEVPTVYEIEVRGEMSPATQPK